jgi:hypothetical protein
MKRHHWTSELSNLLVGVLLKKVWFVRGFKMEINLEFALLNLIELVTIKFLLWIIIKFLSDNSLNFSSYT